MGRGGVSPAYFFYKMTFQEAAAYIRGIDRKERTEWDRTRRMMWATLLPHSKKQLEPEDIIRFEWEKGTDTNQPDEKELERIREIAKNIKL